MQLNTHTATHTHTHTHTYVKSKILECCKADDFVMNGFIGHGED